MKLDEQFVRESIKAMMILTRIKMPPTEEQANRFMERRIHLSTSDSYGSENYRVCFFCVEGSPPRFYGWITRDLANPDEIMATTNKGKFIYRARRFSSVKKWVRQGMLRMVSL